MTTPNVSNIKTKTADYYDADTLGVLWSTTPEAVAELLPPPLVPMELPLVLGFIARFPEVSFGTPYMMGGMFMFCKYKDEVGTYVLSAPENDDFPVFAGREMLGYPKKMAYLEMHQDGNKMSGFIERRGIRLVEIQATFDGELNSPRAEEIFAALSGSTDQSDDGLAESDGINFLFKYAHSADPNQLFEWTPRIVRQVTRQRPKSMEIGNAEIIMKPSPYDSPWGKVPVAEMLGAFHNISHNTMMAPSIVGELDKAGEEAFLPYSYIKYED